MHPKFLMNCLVRNCRGAGKKSTCSYYSRLMRKHKVAMVVLLETQLAGRGLDRAIGKLLRGMQFFAIHSVGRLGCILAFWQCSGSSLEVKQVSRQAFTAVVHQNGGQSWVFARVFVSTRRVKRRELWNTLDQLMGNGLLVCFIKDFNVLFDPSEKHRGQFHKTLEVVEFRESMMNNGLMDIDFHFRVCGVTIC